MTLTFVTNYVHHHQLPVADEFYRILDKDYTYIACEPLPDWLINGGYDPTLDRPYIIRTYRSEDDLNKARRIIDDSDVVIIGSAPNEWVYKRKKENKVTFHYHERWLKKRSIKQFSPKSLFDRWKNYTQFRNKRTYMLCASAFTSKDVKWYGAFPHKCFKWGYFTKVDGPGNLEVQSVSNLEEISIMWCARLMRLKHPELPVQLAYRLKNKGYHISVDMFGSGEELRNIEDLIAKLDVDDCVHLCGNRPNDEILKEMRKHAIFLFTSDRNEGWGAVLNEAMANGCAVVASDRIGSVPFLIKSGKNGLVFRSESVDDLENQVLFLIEHPETCNQIRKEAITTMREVWSPKNAAKAFLNLAAHALADTLDSYYINEGPASWD